MATQTLLDVAGLSDSLRVVVGTVSAADAVGLSDTQTRTGAAPVGSSQYDQLGLSDTLAVVLGVKLSGDTLGLSDTHSKSGAGTNAAWLDDLGLSDRVVVVLGQRFEGDLLGITDPGMSQGVTEVWTDQVSLLEAIPIDQIVPPSRVEDRTDVLGLSDNVVVSFTIIPPNWVFRPPVVFEGPIGDGPLFDRYVMARGVTVLLTGNVATETRTPSFEQVEAADHVFYGGYEYAVEDDVKQILEANGYTLTPRG